jgi:acetyl esterase/lipase
MLKFEKLYEKVGLFTLNVLAKFGRYKLRKIGSDKQGDLQADHYFVDKDAPTVVFFHGGNWRSYKKEDYRFVADTLCSMGVNVLIPDLLKYPEYRFTAILGKASYFLDWLLDFLEIKNDIFLMGHSSGAQIAALIVLNDELSNQDRSIAGMIGLSGPYDFFPFSDNDHWDLFGPEENYPASQPINFVNNLSPELYLLHGASDQRVRRGNSKSLMEKQLAAGGKASREVYSNMGHADTILSFSRLHRRKNRLVRDIQYFINTRKNFGEKNGSN